MYSTSDSFTFNATYSEFKCNYGYRDWEITSSLHVDSAEDIDPLNTTNHDSVFYVLNAIHIYLEQNLFHRCYTPYEGGIFTLVQT